MSKTANQGRPERSPNQALVVRVWSVAAAEKVGQPTNHFRTKEMMQPCLL